MHTFRNKLFILLVVLLTSFSTLSASEYFFSIIDGNSGLSQNNVKSIAQDSYGFMWFGTRNQLNRYDGVSLKTFDCYDHDIKRGNNNISALCEAPSKQLWIGTDNGVYIYDPVFEKFTWFSLETNSGENIHQWVFDIQVDSENNIWIMVPNQGVFKYLHDTNELKLYAVVEHFEPSVSNPQCMTIEKNGRIWIGTNGSGVYLYDQNTDSFTQYLGDNQSYTLAGLNIYAMCSYEEYLIIGIHEGKIYKLDKRRNILSNVSFDDANYKIIRSIDLLNDDEIWIGTETGLFILNEKKKTMEHVFNDPLNKYSLSDNFIERINVDKEGGVWIGTHFGGINYLPARNSVFEKHVPLSKTNSVVSKRIREIHEDKYGNIWIGTEDSGVDVYDVKNKNFKHIEHLHYKKTLALLMQDSQAIIGYFKNGLDLMDINQNQPIRHYSEIDLGLNEASIYAICEDKYGKIWIGNAWGVFVAEKNTMKFKRVENIGSFYSYDIMEDSEGLIWIATMGSGVIRYNQETESIKYFQVDKNNPNSLSSNSVSSITEDHQGRIWFATDRGGICVYNKRLKQFTSYSIKNGLPSNTAYKILEDKSHNLWFGTDQGLVKFHPETKAIRIYTQKDGLMSNQFNYKSALKSSQGKFYFGSLEGLLAFNPDEFEENQYIPPVYITNISINNNEHSLPSEISIPHTKNITLKHNQSTLSFDFVGLSYTAPLANSYMYKMEGLDQNWIKTQQNQSASYTNLRPGKYIFKVKASNNDGIWNDEGASISIEILPPWWASNVSYIIYTILLLVVLYFLGKYLKQRNSKRVEHRQQMFEIEKEKEVYESKVSFFTDIAHEIKTPVTLINGPLESILEMNIEDKEVSKNLHIIERNTKHLLNLINQLLDFRKIDSNKIALSVKRTNISSFLEDIKERFVEAKTFEKRDIELILPELHVFAWVDRGAMSKVINNLFTNAYKYSDKKISIELLADESCFTIKFINDGDLVPKEMINKIFDPFFQVKSNNTGSGIGLSLSRSLIELHNGQLFYETIDGNNMLVLKVPLSQSKIAVLNDKNIIDTDKLIPDGEKTSLSRGNFETILLVEDNIEMLNFIADKLKTSYLVETATNGKEALKILKEKSIDIIVSDVMMPEMDGFELCEKVKNDLEYSHIIFIILTAKNDIESKIKALELGADSYIEKPFSFMYLTALLEASLNNRKREKELFINKPFIPIRQVGMNKADEEFLNNVVKIINDNITDSDFNVEKLAELVFMSRSSLHRKLKSLLDLTPTDFIRIVRLKKAAQLIKEKGFRVNEVCFLVGINSPSYFIKLFQKQFGMTPKEFEKMENN